MTDIINEEENTTPLPEEEQETTVVDNGQTYVSEESAIIAQQAAQEAKLWAEESEAQANIATRASDDAAQAKDDAVAAKEYAEDAVTDVNVVAVGTDLRATPSNIKTVANNISDVTTVATNNTNVTTVANNVSDVNSIATNITNVNTTATNINAINTAATNIVAIQNAPVNAQLARDWAVKMDGLVSGEDYSAKYYADQARQAAAGAVVDGITINRNTDDELQTIGVIDNRSGNALKTWTGTRAEYNAIVTKDSNTLYNITDDSNMAVSLLQTIYPVGSIYIGTMATCPLSALFGTWTLVAANRVLQGSGTNSVGSTVEAGLPNITGKLGNLTSTATSSSGASDSGALFWSNPTGRSNAGGFDARYGYDPQFDASRSNAIYGNSTTVQPPAYVVNIWERTV